MPDTAPQTTVDLDSLGERFAALRLREPAALARVQRSLARHGQLSPIATFEEGGRLELLDGFKRLQAARALGWSRLRMQLLPVTAADAKFAIIMLHTSRGLTELEEAWLLRSLYREGGVSQPEIARRMQRGKSWVSRRLLLVESLDDAALDRPRDRVRLDGHSAARREPDPTDDDRSLVARNIVVATEEPERCSLGLKLPLPALLRRRLDDAGELLELRQHECPTRNRVVQPHTQSSSIKRAPTPMLALCLLIRPSDHRGIPAAGGALEIPTRES